MKQQLIRMQYTAQKDGYSCGFPGSSFEIIFNAELKVGRIWIARLPESIHLVDIAILPQAQNTGIGTNLVRELQREAEAANKPIRLSVFRFNEGSIRFHQRLGFTLIGEDEIQLHFEWNPINISG